MKKGMIILDYDPNNKINVQLVLSNICNYINGDKGTILPYRKLLKNKCRRNKRN
jgi:hypothetical protein